MPKRPSSVFFAGAIFGGSGLVAVSAYFIGVAAIVISGILLKKAKGFAGDPAPFVMELPAYHTPAAGNVLQATWERGWSFIKREMNSPKWTMAAIGYMCGFAYLVALIIYQLGGLVTGEVSFGIGTVAGVLALVFLGYLLVRRNKYEEGRLNVNAVQAAGVKAAK